jgi:hypothetical protein
MLDFEAMEGKIYRGILKLLSMSCALPDLRGKDQPHDFTTVKSLGGLHHIGLLKTNATDWVFKQQKLSSGVERSKIKVLVGSASSCIWPPSFYLLTWSFFPACTFLEFLSTTVQS